jgi:hypothetical protein
MSQIKRRDKEEAKEKGQKLKRIIGQTRITQTGRA